MILVKLIQIMASRLINAKPLPELMLAYCLLDVFKQVHAIFKSNKQVDYSLPVCDISGINVFSQLPWPVNDTGISLLPDRYQAAT